MTRQGKLEGPIAIVNFTYKTVYIRRKCKMGRTDLPMGQSKVEIYVCYRNVFTEVYIYFQYGGVARKKKT